jgi:hypothetical protein
MYYVGSAGTVDPGDIAKIVCADGVIQLGQGVQGIKPAAEEIPMPQTTVTIRYAVPPGPDSPQLGDEMLVLRYRPGSGHIVAVLNEVPLLYADLADPGTVVETTLLEYDSAKFKASNVFLTNSVGGPTYPNPQHVLNFAENAYYISVSLTAPELVVGIPPAVAAVGLVPWSA